LIRNEIKNDVVNRIKRDLTAIYTSNTSARSWEKQRKHQFFTHMRHNAKAHVSALTRYIIDEDKLKERLGPPRNLGKSMNGKWSRLARDIDVRTKTGKEPAMFNSGQVLLEWARSNGYSFEQRTVKRRSLVRTESNVPGFRTTSAKKIKNLRDTMIRNAEINIGEKFYPVSSTKRTLLNNEGQFVSKSRDNPARVININYLRLKHLQSMKSRGLLRVTDTSSFTTDALRQLLQSKDSK
jgi:hypothetical protein